MVIGDMTDVRLSHPVNALSVIVVTEAGMVNSEAVFGLTKYMAFCPGHR